MNPCRILIVEDEAIVAMDIQERLAHLGYEIADHAISGEQALALARQKRPSLVLTDIRLQGTIDGITVAQEIRRELETPVVFLTAYSEDVTLERAKLAQPYGYVLKPFDDRELRSVIEIALYKHGVEQELRESERKHRELAESLHELSARLLQIQDEERRRLARELHDTIAQKLAALSMRLPLLGSLIPMPNPDAQAMLAESVALVQQAASEIRTMSYLLHPPVLDALGLAGAIQEYTDGFIRRSGISVHLELPKRLGRLPRNIEMTFFRVLQESLANIHRHSGSPTASVGLFQRDDEIVLEVRDVGRGMPEELRRAIQGGMTGGKLGVGIVGMNERLRQLGGRLDILSDPAGTTVRAHLPLPPGLVMPAPTLAANQPLASPP